MVEFPVTRNLPHVYNSLLFLSVTWFVQTILACVSLLDDLLGRSVLEYDLK